MGSVSRIGFGILVYLALMQVTTATEVKINEDLDKIVVDVMGVPFTIERNQNTQNRLNNSYTKTSRPCPPFCVQPFVVAPGVKTIGELELIAFLKKDMAENSGLLVDARMPKWYKQGTIPGALNIPFSIFSKENGDTYINKLLPLLGAQKGEKGWNFDHAKRIVIFDNGPWCQQGRLAIENLLKLGYPSEKILYYRGGVQYWQILGFTMMKPQV